MSIEPRGDTTHRDRLARALGSAYELRDPLGSGGFAEVYAAWDTGLKREVAVKVLRAELAPEPTLVARFRREAETVAQLRHPNIIPIYQVGEHEGLVYFIMPLVQGESLSEFLAREPQPPFAEVRRILMETAGALHTAHAAGLIHRDIKPDNIMLDGEDRRVLVMDFGIAKPLAEREVALTATGMIIGTPQYMSPEQGTGEGAVDHRSDLYSLGVVGYQMIAGQLPFEAGTVIALMMAHATEQPASLRDARPDCPADLEAAVLRCLAKEPDRRWRSAGDLREALTEARTSLAVDTPVAVSPVAEADRADPVRAFRRWMAVSVALAAAALALDLIVVPGIQFAPFAFVVALFLGAAAYGRLSMEGRDWRDVLQRSSGRAPTPTPTPSWTPSTPVPSAGSDDEEFGAHADGVRGVRADRAALVGLLARLPSSERKVLAEVLPVVDRLLVESTELARKLHSLEERFQDGLAEEDRAAAETRRAEITGQMKRAVDAVGDIRRALRRVGRDGLTVAAPGVRAVLEAVLEGDAD